jgi:hypothetical protein
VFESCGSVSFSSSCLIHCITCRELFLGLCFMGLSFDNGSCFVLGLILCGIFPSPQWKRCGESVGCLVGEKTRDFW